jgi:hypothetical protein
MSEQTTEKEPYFVTIYEPQAGGEALIFAFTPKGLQQARGHDGAPKRVPQFTVKVRQEAGRLSFDWNGTPDDPGAEKQRMEDLITERMKDRTVWVDRVSSLVNQVEQWAKELGWSTRRVEKKLDDGWIGQHRVPALLLQEDTCRILLEPVGRSAPGVEGVVDFYLMPAYDDIASLYYYGNQWNVHYMFPDTKPAATVREAEPMPMSKETLAKILVEMKQNAA